MMKKSMMVVALAAAVPLFSGCAATQVAIAKRDLDVQTRMSATIFLSPIKESERIVFVQYRNTSDKPDLDMAAELEAAVANKGYRITRNPDEAHYLLQANVLHVGKTDPTAAQTAFNGGFGGSLGAGMGVAAAAYATGHSNERGMVGAVILGAIGNTVANAMVKDVYFSIVTDVQIQERSRKGTKVQVESKHTLQQGTSGSSQSSFTEESEFKVYQTRVMSTANKVNLEFAEAAQPLRTGLVRALSGVF